jgi:ABC-2 type transport system permease protein
MVGIDNTADRSHIAQRRGGGGRGRIGGRDGEPLHPVEPAHGWPRPEDEQLRAVPGAADRVAGHRIRAATDSVQGINLRFQSLPIPSLTPLAARITASVYRCVIGLIVALACGHVIGFKFHRGPWYAAAFCLLTLLTGLALALVGDTLGTKSRDPAATAQWLLLPQLIFGFLSVGIQPLHRFPHWVQPIVDNQPISRLVYAMQALAGDSGEGVPPVTWSVIGPALAWVVGIIAVTLPWAIAVYRRRT